jgi:hypothetical protein
MATNVENRQTGNESGDRTDHLFILAAINCCHRRFKPFLNIKLESCGEEKSGQDHVFLQDTADETDYQEQ